MRRKMTCLEAQPQTLVRKTSSHGSSCHRPNSCCVGEIYWAATAIIAAIQKSKTI